jgi:hypothetical protein
MPVLGPWMAVALPVPPQAVSVSHLSVRRQPCGAAAIFGWVRRGRGASFAAASVPGAAVAHGPKLGGAGGARSGTPSRVRAPRTAILRQVRRYRLLGPGSPSWARAWQRGPRALRPQDLPSPALPAAAAGRRIPEATACRLDRSPAWLLPDCVPNPFAPIRCVPSRAQFRSLCVRGLRGACVPNAFGARWGDSFFARGARPGAARSGIARSGRPIAISFWRARRVPSIAHFQAAPVGGPGDGSDRRVDRPAD